MHQDNTRTAPSDGSATRLAAFVLAVEGCVGGPLAETEHAEAERWHRLGAPTGHVAVVIQDARQTAEALARRDAATGTPATTLPQPTDPDA